MKPASSPSKLRNPRATRTGAGLSTPHCVRDQPGGPRSWRRVPCLGAWLSALCLSVGLVEAGQTDFSAQELIAATTDLPETVAVTHYDIALRTDLDQNRVRVETICTVRKQSREPLAQVDFDLLAAEQFYGAKVELQHVWAIGEGPRVACRFRHASREKATAPGQEGTHEFPKLAQVVLPSALAASAECRLQFDYSITVLDPTKDMNYRLIAQVPDGNKEVCLMGDFTWIPRAARKSAGKISLGDRNFFTKGTKPTWRLTLTHPAALESLVLDGRLESSERGKDVAVSRYRSVSGGHPQFLIGPGERAEVSGRSIPVVYLLPKGKCTRQEIEKPLRQRPSSDGAQPSFGSMAAASAGSSSTGFSRVSDAAG